jgi:LysR family transcriptional regulator, low CO2-responsive transcriptional regulator
VVTGRDSDTDPTTMKPELLPYLDTFAEAAERLSFTAAARALGLTQAAVSQRVQALERELGVPLFRRVRGKVELTDTGRRLHEYARRILDLHREARETVTGRETPVEGELAIAASSIPGDYLLPALLAAFGPKHPHVRVRAAVSDSAGVFGQLERGEASVGLVGQKPDECHFEVRHLADDRMVLVVPPCHALARKRAVPLDELAAHPLVLRESGSGLRHSFEAALARAGRSLADLRVALELGSNEAIQGAVLRGVGVAVLSALAVRKEVAAGRLVALTIDGLCCAREMFVVTDRRRVLPAPARLFVNLLDAGLAPDLTS